MAAIVTTQTTGKAREGTTEWQGLEQDMTHLKPLSMFYFFFYLFFIY